jgi:hypothetical protein
MMTFSITTFSIMTFSIMTFSIFCKFDHFTAVNNFYSVVKTVLLAKKRLSNFTEILNYEIYFSKKMEPT